MDAFPPFPPAGMLTAGFQPEIVPSSVAKMKRAGWPAGVPLLRRKSLGLPLKTMPVGVAAAPGVKPGGGTITKLSNVLPGGSGKKVAGITLPLLSTKCGRARVIVADPPGTSGAARDSPGVFQIRIKHNSRTVCVTGLNDIGDQVLLCVVLRGAQSGKH